MSLGERFSTTREALGWAALRSEMSLTAKSPMTVRDRRTRLSRRVQDVRDMVGIGWFVATAYCAIALVTLLLKGPQPAVLAAHAGLILGLLLTYVVGFLLAGLIVGLVYPLTRNFAGRVFVAILALLPISTGFGIRVLIMEGAPRAWGHDFIKPVLLFAGFFGVAVAVYTWLRGFGRE